MTVRRRGAWGAGTLPTAGAPPRLPLSRRVRLAASPISRAGARIVARSARTGALALLLGACRETPERPLQTVAGGDAERGRVAIAAYGCGGCHTVPGVPGARATVGPPLVDFADRHYVAGRLPNRPEQLVHWIRNPQAVSPGTAMPDLGVPEQAALDMAAYLYTLGRGGLGAPHLLPKEWLPAH